MSAPALFFVHHPPWVLADTSRSTLEVLGVIAAVIGVLLWVGGLVWLVLADAIRALHRSRTHDHHGPSPGPDRPSQ